MRKRKLLPPGTPLLAWALACALLLAACPTGGAGPDDEGGPGKENSNTYEGKLLILQTYGTGSGTDGAVSHNFVELYNNSEAALDLSGLTLQYADGTDGGTPPKDPDWKVISLSGSLPARHSFLILGKKNNTAGRLQLADNSGDINDGNFVLNNHAYKVALLQTGSAITAANPFNPKVSGYIDMIGATNTDDGDSIDAYETAAYAGISKQKSARRTSLSDTNDNSRDFVLVDYRTTGVTSAQAEAWKPKNTGYGQWDPVAEVEEPPPPDGSAKLMILQAFGHDDKNDPAITHCFVELYNNTGSAINLGAYSLQIANSAAGAEWTVINLSGSIPARGSYLIRGAVDDDISDSRLNLTSLSPDVDGSFLLSNNEFKIALMSNQTVLTVANPFDTGNGASAAGYVDMLGTGSNTTKVTGYETAPLDGISKQKSARRKYLADTDNNAEDFKIHDYRTSNLSDDDLEKCRPRTAVDGSWTPEFP